MDARSVAQRRSVSREVGVVDGDAVGKPSSPPAVRSGRHHGVIATGQESEIFSGRMTLGERNVHPTRVPGRRPDVFSTPRDVVAGDDELDPRKPLDEVAHGPPQIGGSGGREALPDSPRQKIIAATDVNADANVRRSRPAGRRVAGQEASRKPDKLPTESERATKPDGDGIDVLPAAEKPGQQDGPIRRNADETFHPRTVGVDQRVAIPVCRATILAAHA